MNLNQLTVTRTGQKRVTSTSGEALILVLVVVQELVKLWLPVHIAERGRIGGAVPVWSTERRGGGEQRRRSRIRDSRSPHSVSAASDPWPSSRAGEITLAISSVFS